MISLNTASACTSSTHSATARIDNLENNKAAKNQAVISIITSTVSEVEIKLQQLSNLFSQGLRVDAKLIHDCENKCVVYQKG